ncbi:hypothetical protein KI387_028097, partial [Taxus chinensis]
MQERSTRFGSFGRKGSNLHFLTLGQLGRKLPTGPKMEQLQGFRPIGEQNALRNLGH